MTVKKRLHAIIETLSEDEAERVLSGIFEAERRSFVQPSLEEVKRWLSEIADLQNPETPPLPDEAWSREEIYY